VPTQEVLILAMTKMLSGICAAGVTTEPDPVTGLRWVRPVRDFDTLQPGDMTTADGRLIQCGDVIEMRLIEPRPDPPHVEDWLADLVHHRPAHLRTLSGQKRSRFFARYLDRAPEQVIVHHTRSLCLVHPQDVWAEFALDAYSGQYQARMGFVLGSDPALAHDTRPVWATGQRGIAVTDLKWRALGRAWVRQGGKLRLHRELFFQRLEAQDLYLSLGLSRNWQGQYWPLVVGVHLIPDYQATIDLDHL
jgi:hypothetical protein